MRVSVQSGMPIQRDRTGADANGIRLFVYGTLKRGHRLHSHLKGQSYLGEGQTLPEFRLLNCGWYPALVESEDGRSICGEVWQVDNETLKRLDEVEDVGSGLYERREISLLAPFDDAAAITYVYLQDVTGLADCGDEWLMTSTVVDPDEAS